MFSEIVRDYWTPKDQALNASRADELQVIIDEEQPGNRSLMVLELVDGTGTVTLSQKYASRIGLIHGSSVSQSGIHSALDEASVVMNDPDHLFYLPIEEQSSIKRERLTEETRQLSMEDAEMFAQFVKLAPEDDLDEAFVELNHWLVFGTLLDGHLVSAASMFPWKGTLLADFGVITLPEYRGIGLAKRTVRAMSARALSEGFEPQYRCQIDNESSVALAHAAGFARFGSWHVIKSDN